MIQRVSIFIATLLILSLSAQAEQTAEKTENSDTVEAVMVDATEATEEVNTSGEANASEMIAPLTEEKQKPAM